METIQVELKEVEIQRINQLIGNFAKTDPHVLKYSQVLMLMLDRCILSNKFTLGDFHNLFMQLYSRSKQPRMFHDQKVLSKDQLIIMFSQMGKTLFKPDQKYLQRFYNTFLTQKIQSQNGEINHSRVMLFDSTNSRLVTEQCVGKIAEYEDELRHVFIMYLFENYWSMRKTKRILLTLREIILQNKKWSFTSLIHFLKDSQTTPHIVNIEHIEQILRFIIPNINTAQQQFYSRHIISDNYHKQAQNNEQTYHKGDPGIMFFEFEFIIARIALDGYVSNSEKKGVYQLRDVLERYFDYLMLRKNSQLNNILPNTNKKMINLIKQYYRLINSSSNIKSQTKLLSNHGQSLTAFEKLATKMKDQIINGMELNVDFNECYKSLDRELPKIPTLPKVEPEYLPPYKKEIAITIGQQPPPQPVEDSDKIKVEKKKDAGKKDQIPPRQFKWATIPQTKKATEDCFKQISSKLNFEVTPLSSIQRGTIKKQVYPIIIGQTLCPPEIPKSVAPFLTMATNAMIESNYILAIENYNNGASAWKRTMVEFQPTVELYFQYMKGSIYLRAGRYDYAFYQFYKCRNLLDQSKIPFSNPDRSLPYFGLGEVFYEMEEYELSARAFLKARQIRQSVLGLEHVQTATVFNNLACCYYMIGRKQECVGYIEIAEVVLDMELGQHHQRTMTARFNMNLIMHGSIDNKPQFRKFWQVFEEDKFEKKKKKKQKKAKQGKKK